MKPVSTTLHLEEEGCSILIPHLCAHVTQSFYLSSPSPALQSTHPSFTVKLLKFLKFHFGGNLGVLCILLCISISFGTRRILVFPCPSAPATGPHRRNTFTASCSRPGKEFACVEGRAHAQSDPTSHITTHPGQIPSLFPGKGRDAMGEGTDWLFQTEFPKTPLKKPPLPVLRDWLAGAPYEGLP
jgi:hypothetical protein